jgi:chemotaxis protein methyltransferase CheR
MTGPAADAGGDAACVAFLRWALPRLGLQWPGYRKVRRGVCKRVRRRARELGLAGDLAAYGRHLEDHPDEWGELERRCLVTSSRFYRDRRVFDVVGREILPALAARATARDEDGLRAWSAGCASGEEPYTLALVWRLAVAEAFPGLALDILATDVEQDVLARARRACFPASSLRELPPGWRERAFERRDGEWCLQPGFRGSVTFRRHDVRAGRPDGPFSLILCRNLAFTYFEPRLQEEVAATLVSCLQPGGALVVGAHERPPAAAGLERSASSPAVYRKP